MIADEFCTKFQGKSSFLYFVGKNKNNSHIMWNCDSFDLQYNGIIRKKQVQKQVFYIGVWQNKCGKKGRAVCQLMIFRS